jgi:hypothetical protein
MVTAKIQPLVILARLIRLRDAPMYLGMDRNRFARVVRPYLTDIPIGKQGIAFGRLGLDDWVEQYKARNGLPSKLRGEVISGGKESLGSIDEKASGTSTSRSAGSDFARRCNSGRKTTQWCV